MAEDFASGKQTSDAVSPSFAGSPQLQQVHGQMSKLGAVQSLVFKGVGPGGADIYSVRFEKGALETRIWLGLDGKIENSNVRPDEGGIGVAAAALQPIRRNRCARRGGTREAAGGKRDHRHRLG